MWCGIVWQAWTKLIFKENTMDKYKQIALEYYKLGIKSSELSKKKTTHKPFEAFPEIANAHKSTFQIALDRVTVELSALEERDEKIKKQLVELNKEIDYKVSTIKELIKDIAQLGEKARRIA
jgi:hypothetical protein